RTPPPSLRRQTHSEPHRDATTIDVSRRDGERRHSAHQEFLRGTGEPTAQRPPPGKGRPSAARSQWNSGFTTRDTAHSLPDADPPRAVGPEREHRSQSVIKPADAYPG